MKSKRLDSENDKNLVKKLPLTDKEIIKKKAKIRKPLKLLPPEIK